MGRYILACVFLAVLVATANGRRLQQGGQGGPAPRAIITQNANGNATGGPAACIYQTITLMSVDKFSATSVCNLASGCEWDSIQTSEECQFWCDQNEICSVWHFNGNPANLGQKCMLYTGAIRPSRGLSGNSVGFKMMGVGGKCQTEVPGLVVEEEN